MRHLALATVLLSLFGVGQLAALPSEPLCCACLPRTGMNSTGTDAAFCATLQPGNSVIDTCDEIGGQFYCIPGGFNQSCRVELGEAGIDCPTSGVPVADPLNLTALAVLLGAAGTAALRRRSRRDG